MKKEKVTLSIKDIERIKECGEDVAFYKYWKFTIESILLDYEPETRGYKVYVHNPNLYFPSGDCEAPEDFESLEDAKGRVCGFINENF